MSAFQGIYRPTRGDEPLRQGEILSDLVRYRVDPRTVRPVRHETVLQVRGGQPYAPFITAVVQEATPNVFKADHPYVVVVSQDCDLDQQKRPAVGLAPLLPCVLLAEVTTAVRLRGQKDVNSETWKLIRQNREERYHFLEAVPKEHDAASEGLDELALDFKRYLAVPTDELYALVDAGLARRRCVLNSPYMEHLCNRFGNYLNRVALPEPHFSTPAEAKPG